MGCYGVLGLNPTPYVYSPRAWGGGGQQAAGRERARLMLSGAGLVGDGAAVLIPGQSQGWVGGVWGEFGGGLELGWGR